MRLNLDMPLLQMMTEGVILMDRHAHVNGFNRSAEEWLPLCKTHERALQRMIDEETRGLVTLPEPIVFMVPKVPAPTPAPQHWLVKNGKAGYAILIVSMATKVPAASEIKVPLVDRREAPIVALLSDSVRGELAALRGLLKATAGAQTERTVLAEQCAKVDKLLDQVSKLSALKQQDAVFLSERISVDTVISNCMDALRPRSARLGVEFRAKSATDAHIYGEAKWLNYAMLILLGQLLQGAPPKSQIDLRVTQMGDFVVIAGKVNNNVGPEPGNLRSTGAAPSDTLDPAAYSDSAVKMSMCQRIVELHAGNLKLEHFPGATPGGPALADLESFVLTLLTGMPNHERSHISCQACPHISQVEAYAQDFSHLLAEIDLLKNKP